MVFTPDPSWGPAGPKQHFQPRTKCPPKVLKGFNFMIHHTYVNSNICTYTNLDLALSPPPHRLYNIKPTGLQLLLWKEKMGDRHVWATGTKARVYICVCQYTYIQMWSDVIHPTHSIIASRHLVCIYINMYSNKKKLTFFLQCNHSQSHTLPTCVF